MVGQNQLRAQELSLEAKKARLQNKYEVLGIGKKLFSRSSSRFMRKIDVGWILLIVSVSLMFLTLIPYIWTTKSVPGFGLTMSMLLFAIVPSMVYYFITGGNFVEAILAVIIVFVVLAFGNKIDVLQPIYALVGQSYTVGEPLRQGLMSLFGII